MCGLNLEDLNKIKGVFQKYPEVKKVILYGSRAKGNFKNGSDIDLSLMGEGLNLSLLTQISLTLDELYLPYSFDLSLYEMIQNENLIDHIQRVGIVFYESSSALKTKQE